MYELILLRDQRPLSKSEFAIASMICEKISRIVKTRASYINDHGLDPEIAMPSANWAEGPHNDFFNAYRHVVSPKYDIINTLRFYTQTFTGCQLISFSDASGKPSVNPIPANFDENMGELLLSRSSWVRDYLNLTRYLPTEIVAKPPKMFAEIGISVNGNPVNPDVCSNQDSLNLIYEAGIFDRLRRRVKEKGRVSILEIGAGYGGLAYHIKHIIPEAEYYICDLPEALLFSVLYLVLTSPDQPYTIYDGTDQSVLHNRRIGYTFVPNYVFDNLVMADMKFDVAFNTASFSEMSEKQVRYYFHNLSRLLADNGILFEQNKVEESYTHNLCKSYLSEYFAFRRSIQPEPHGGMTKGPADVWANRRIADLLHLKVKRRILRKIRYLRTIRPLSVIESIIGERRFATLSRFVRSKPVLRRTILRILGEDLK